MPVPQTPEAIWDSLTDVERTALQTSLFRWDGENELVLPDGQKLYDGDLDRLLVSACMPLGQQDEYRNRLNPKYLLPMMALRTSVIDWEATKFASFENVRQVVILGAGLDTRAWRLAWPDHTTVFEVDTGSLEPLKGSQLAAVAPKSPTCQRRFLPADLVRTQEVQQGLRALGLDAGRLALWVLEGLVGYLRPEDSLALFRMMRESCAAGSRALITVPPTVRIREDAAQLGQRLHHATFETADATLARLQTAGWSATMLDFATTGPQTGLSWRQLIGMDEPQGLVVGVAPHV